MYSRGRRKPRKHQRPREGHGRPSSYSVEEACMVSTNRRSPRPLSLGAKQVAGVNCKPSETPSTMWLKIAVLVVIALLVLSGMIFMAAGLWFVSYLNGPALIVQEYYKFANVNRISIAVSIFVGTIIGCCGVCYERFCPLCLFFLFSFALFCTGLSVPWVENANLALAEKQSEQHMMAQMRRYWDNNDKAPSEAWDALQRQLACCGLNGSADWTPFGMVPKSCGSAPKELPGCLDTLIHGMDVLRIVMTVAYASLVVFEFVGLFPTSCLANRLRDR